MQNNAYTKLIYTVVVLSALVLALLAYIGISTIKNAAEKNVVESNQTTAAAYNTDIYPTIDTSKIPNTPEGKIIRYGHELIAHTAKYIGPKGSVGHYTNSMNCQNCHLDAGTKAFGNNYFSVHATYPKFRDRSGSIETEAKRVSDCMERSLNGKAVSADSKEMQAILAYLRWVGTGVPIGKKAAGSGLKDISYLNRAADTAKGWVLYSAKCQLCHSANGEGKLNESGSEYTYPPLWGEGSYNNGAGLYRISNFAKYIKYNMPLPTSYDKPQLTDEEAWDIAAFVNSQPRPVKNLTHDWPDISKKPIDYPCPPYTDGFSSSQHKYGPFKPIAEAHKKGI